MATPRKCPGRHCSFQRLGDRGEKGARNLLCEAPGTDRRFVGPFRKKVSGTFFPADVDPRGVARRVHLLVRRSKDDLRSAVGQQLEIGVQRAGILREILGRSELRRIDVDRDDRAVAFGLGRAHQAQVPFVQRPHRRHESDSLAGTPQLGERLSQFGNSRDELGHVEEHVVNRT